MSPERRLSWAHNFERAFATALISLGFLLNFRSVRSESVEDGGGGGGGGASMRFSENVNTCAGKGREKIQTFEKFKLSVCDD